MIIDRSFYHFDKLIYSPIAEPQDLASFRAIGDPLGTPLVSFFIDERVARRHDQSGGWGFR